MVPPRSRAVEWDVEKSEVIECPPRCLVAGEGPGDREGSDSSWSLASLRKHSTLDTSRPCTQENKETRRTTRALQDIVTIYGCLFVVILAANAIAMLYTIFTLQNRKLLWFESAATPVAVNLMMSLLARNEHFVNSLFQVGCVRPTLASFSVRSALSQVHHYGGLHSGCAVAALLWYCLQTVLVTISFAQGQADALCVAISWVILLLLIMIILSALPRVRRAMHDYFEATHRFAGWSIVVLVWIQLVKFASVASPLVGKPSSQLVMASSATWFLAVATLLVIYPWLRLRKRDVQARQLSEHAVQLQFDGYAGPCTAVKLSDSPLRENHPFACIPERDQRKTFSVIISKAGDWTARLIESPPGSLWIRETPQRGVLWVARMFSPVVIVATGSGIGPCLGLFNGSPELQCRVLWSTRQPLATYGAGVLANVRRADPDAVIIDTDQCGRPNLPLEAERLYREAGAEAVVIISNRTLTYSIVRYLTQRGICARGPIWDS